MDVEALLFQMRNQRYAKVIRMLIIDDMEPEKVAQELAVTIDNLYNIKRRAMAALTKYLLIGIKGIRALRQTICKIIPTDKSCQIKHSLWDAIG